MAAPQAPAADGMGDIEMGIKMRWLLCAVTVMVGICLPGCGNQSVIVSIGRIELTAVNLDGTVGPGCTVGGPGPFPTVPTEFALSGTGFSTIPGATVIVRFTAVGGARPFHGGTTMTIDEVGTVVSDTLICGETPVALVCGVASIDATMEVILPSGVRDDSTVFSAGPVFTITFAAPVITSFVPPCVPSLTPVTFTITGTGFGNDGDIVTVRFSSSENLPAGDPIFADGTSTLIDVTGTVGGGGTTITGTTPRATNQVEPAANPLHAVSDPLEDSAVDVILSNGSCTSGPGTGSTQFDRPEGDTITAPTLTVPTSVPQTIATPFVITGTAPAPCPDGFGPVGGTVQVSFSAPGSPSVPALAFQLNASGAGTADFDVVDAEIISPTEIRGMTPIVRARDDFLPVVRIHFEDGTIAPVTTPFTWEAPPVIDAIANLDGLTGNGVLQALPATEFLGCHSSTMEITGVNFTNPQPPLDPVVLVYDQNTGTSRSFGTANPAQAPPGNDLGPVFTPTATVITGETRLEGLLATLDTDNDGVVSAVVRVTASDGQFGEFVVPYNTSQPPFNLSNDGTATNNNTSITIDPTSVLDDFGASLNDGTPGANLLLVAEADVLFQPPPPLFPFGATEVFTSRSIDGGVNWTNGVIDDGNDSFAADAFRNYAMASYDSFGNVFVSYLVDDLATLTSNIEVMGSTNQGATWVDVSVNFPGTQGYLFGTLDRPCLATGNAADPNVSADQQICVSFVDVLGSAFPAGPVSQVLVSAFRLGGLGGFVATTGPILVNDGILGNGNLLQHARCAVGNQGELYVVWSDLDAPFPAPPPPTPPVVWALLMDVDIDGPFGPVHAFVGDSLVDRIAVPSAPRLSSPDFGPPVPLTDICVVQAGANAGRCVVAYEDVLPGQGGVGGPDVTAVITRATDSYGFSWLARSTVHPVSADDHYLPALCSDPVTGRVYVTWGDTSLDGAGLLIDRFSAASDDGQSWGDALRLSIVSSEAPAGDGEFPDYGTQAGVCAHGGCVFAAWPESPAGSALRKDALVRLYQQTARSSP